MARRADGWGDLFWWSADGLRLHARDYPGPAEVALPPLLCLPGLTRNARDFEALATRLSATRRVIAIDFRGRGESAFARDPMSYVPLSYAQDIAALVADPEAGAGLSRFALVATSMGGIVALLLAGMLPGRVAGVLLNDIGPQVEPAGLARVRSYVGRASTWPTWMHAARCVQEMHGDIYPGWSVEQWLALAKRLYRLNSAGRIMLDYDLRIAEPFRLDGDAAGPDLWRALDALRDVPVLVVRGARSDFLSAATAARMVERLCDAELLTLAGIGHAPTLDEPAVQEATARWLDRVDRSVAA